MSGAAGDGRPTHKIKREFPRYILGGCVANLYPSGVTALPT